MKRISVIVTLLGGICATALLLGGWGAVENFCPTHQFILTEAYLLLQKDAAFKDSPFPFLNDIMRWEGVQAANLSLLSIQAFGPGPDVPGATNFSDHYFNPAIKAGFAPAAAMHYFSALMRGPGAGEEWGKGACWTSHFVSDMAVPHHVIGIPKWAAEQVSQNRRRLTWDDTGLLALYGNDSSVAGWGAGGDFSKATKNFLETSAGRADADWYDPWYANGTPASETTMVSLSSHVGWEKWAHDTVQDSVITLPHGYDFYDSAWKNTDIDPAVFDDVLSSRAVAAGRFVSLIAAATRQSTPSYLRIPKDAIMRAIIDTATIWRASFSALRPSLEAGQRLEGFDPFQRRIVLRVDNAALFEAKNVTARITTVYPNGQTRQSIVEVNPVLGPNGHASIDWILGTQMQGDHRIIVEVQGQYAIPDLQYARIEAIVRFDAPESSAEMEGLWREEPYPGDRKAMRLKIWRENGEYIAMVDSPERVTADQTGFIFGQNNMYIMAQKVLVFRDTGGQEFQGQLLTDVAPGVFVQGRGWVYNWQMAWRPCRIVWDGKDIFRVFYQGYLMNNPQQNALRFARER